MVSTSDFKKGLKILVKKQPYNIVDFQHVKPGKGNQFTRTKLKHLVTGVYLDLTIRSGEKFDTPDVMYKDMNFLYQDSDHFHFMDNESYEQIIIQQKAIGDLAVFLIENIKVKVCFLDQNPVGIELPKTVVLKITKTDPGFKGNTVTGGAKPAVLETGLVLQVPLHLNEGDTIKVNTSDSSYMERIKD